MKKIQILQKGGMLLEALAVLGLVTITAPVVYKKAVEKSQEMEDISVASQMRTVRDAAAIYIEKNYETLQDGDKLNLTELRRYLPPNFLENMNKNLADLSGVTPGTPAYDTKINQSMTIVVKKNQTTVGSNARPVKRASAYIISNMLAGGKDTADEKRGNRIASLIGSEGGYVIDDSTVMGSNNAWQRDISQIDNTITIQEGQIIAGTTFSKEPLSGDFLYRNSVEGFPQFNMMMTNLDLNGNSIEKIRSLGLKYNIDDDYNSIEFRGDSGELIGRNNLNRQTLLMQANEGDGSGALELTAENQEGCARMGADFDGAGAGGMTACNKAGKETVAMASSGLDGRAEGKTDNNEKKKFLRQSGRLDVSGGGASNAEASAYGEYNVGKGGALTVSTTQGKFTGKFIGSDDDSLGASEADSSKLQLSDQGGVLKAQVTGTAKGGRMLVGDGDLNTGDNQTVFANAEDASITAKKAGKGYARIDAKYETTGKSGAFIIANNNTGAFALQTDNVVGVLANQNNSGYLRLSNGTAAQERVKIVADGETGVGGATYLSVGTGPVSRNVIMEANRGGSNSGYMQFNGGVGATIDSNRSGTSVFHTNNNSAVLSSNDGGAGSLDLGSGTAKLQASTPSLALTGSGNVNITTSEAKVTGGQGSVVMNSSSGEVKVANTSGDRIIASRDYTGNQGTVRVLDTAGADGVTMVGNSLIHSTVGGATAGGGAFYVSRTKGGANKKTGSFIANGPNDGGWIQLSADVQDEGKVDLYASKNSGDGSQTSSYGHFFGTDKKDSVVIMSRFGGVTPHYNDGTKNTEPTDYSSSFKNNTNFHENKSYKGYSYAETGTLNASGELNTTHLYTKGGITVDNGKLYASVLCIDGGNNPSEKKGEGVDTFRGGGKPLDWVSNNIDSSGSGKCIPLPKDARWRDIIYDAAVTTLKTGYGAERGHKHPGFEQNDHKHPDYIDVQEHHGDGGTTKWCRPGTFNAGHVCKSGSSTSDGGEPDTHKRCVDVYSSANSYKQECFYCYSSCGISVSTSSCIYQTSSDGCGCNSCDGKENCTVSCPSPCYGSFVCSAWKTGCDKPYDAGPYNDKSTKCCKGWDVEDERDSYWVSNGKKGFEELIGSLAKNDNECKKGYRWSVF